jgi:hypothetical protein
VIAVRKHAIHCGSAQIPGWQIRADRRNIRPAQMYSCSKIKNPEGVPMKKLVWLLALLPTLALAQGPFDGTWVTKMDTVKVIGKPDVYVVADGMYSCEACYPGLKIKADGTDQKVTGHAYYDTASARLVNAQTVEVITHRDGKMVAKRTLSVSADGKTMTEDFINYDGPTQSTGKFVSTRVADAPAGSHALSGSWRPETKGTTLSADLITVTYQQSADGLKMNSPTGQSYDAKFDGTPVLTAGDPGKTMAALKLIDAHTIQETDTRQGKVTDVVISKVSADGKTMHIVDHDKLHGTEMTYTAEKK